MNHQTCDLCGQELLARSEVRYEVRIEVKAAYDPLEITEEDLVKLEAKMSELAKKNEVYQRKEISKGDAVQYFTDKGDEYKLDLLQNLKDGDELRFGVAKLRIIHTPGHRPEHWQSPEGAH